MNVVPKLIDSPSWSTIAAFSGNEMVEFVMFALLSAGLIAACCYGIYAFVKGLSKH